MLIIDKLAYTSKLRGESPNLKVAFSISTLVLCIATSSIYMSVLILVIMGYLTVRYSQISFCGYMKMMVLPISFLLLSLVGIIFDISSYKYDFFNISLGNFYIAISLENLIHGIKLFSVSFASVSCLYFLSLTTPMIDIIGVMKRVRMPSIFVELTLLIYRFMFVLLEMAENITISQNSRLGNVSFSRKLKSVSMTLSVILIRALAKANRLYSAMESRCYDGNIRVLWEADRASSKKKLIFVLYILGLTFLGIIIKVKGVL